MGNSATIKVKADKQERCIYLHWDGGAGSVAAMLKETKIRMDSDVIVGPRADKEDKDAEIQKFYAIFYGVARDLFAYCSEYKDRSPNSVVMKARDSKLIGSNNGEYLIENDFSCKRIDLDNFGEHEDEDQAAYDKARYDSYNNFFDIHHHAVCTVVEGEEPTYKEPEHTLEQLKVQLSHAKAIAKSANLRAERIAKKVEQAEAQESEELIHLAIIEAESDN